MKYILVFLLASQACLFVHGLSFNSVKNAVKKNAIPILEGFIQNGGNPNMVGPSCYKSLLMWAAISGAAQSAKFLLEHGAYPNLTERNTQMTALMYATKNNQRDVVRILMNHNADKNMYNSNGKTAMDIARDQGYYNQMVEYF